MQQWMVNKYEITSMEKNLHILYRINEQDRIVFVNDAWNQFAMDNNTPELLSERILNRSLWDFISDPTTINFYRTILQRVRNGRSMEFNLRCDTAELRRFFVMNISFKDGAVQFDSQLIREEKRSSQKILQGSVGRKDEVIIICSWCGRINTGNNEWQEVEDAVKVLGLFELSVLPQISHGMCNDCYKLMFRKL